MSAFDFAGIEVRMPSLALRAQEKDVWSSIDLKTLRLVPCLYEGMAQWEANTIKVMLAITSGDLDRSLLIFA